jgi:breast cancer 2 susceptibility protein
VQIADGAYLILNELSQTGIAEFKSSFLCLSGVDVTRVPELWIENAFKWIVLKLASMDRHYTDKSTQFLNPENVMLQLKYRYDHEIDNLQRPALRKILEKADLPSKPMCLFVANIIYKNWIEFDLELSDGWYGIRTEIDAVLRHFVEIKKIKIGTKLMLQNAELVGIGETGCEPLKVSLVCLSSIIKN